MIRYFTLLFVGILTSITSAQEGEIVYKTYFKKENDDNSDFSLKIEREINRLRFSLKYNSEGAYFSNMPHAPDDPLSAKMALVSVGTFEDWYQLPKERISFYNRDIAGTTYTVVYENYMRDWVFTNETKKIENYTCYKATLDLFVERTSQVSQIIAWYTLDIPIPYGPAGFGGLPGLILELKYKQAVYVAKEITLNPPRGIKKYPEPSLENKIDEKEMVRLMRASRKVTPD